MEEKDSGVLALRSFAEDVISLVTMLVGVPLTLINRGWPSKIRAVNYVNVSNVPRVDINNLSSYFVVGKVFKILVSFLVDTGAGVSLFQEDEWDRATYARKH